MGGQDTGGPAAEKTALVTGASKGIGRALAIALSRNGWRVGILARNEAGLLETYEALTKVAGIEHAWFPCDISMWGDCRNAADRIKEDFRHLDLLVNNAFGYGESQLADLDPGDIHDLFATSCTGTALLTKAFLPLLQSTYSSLGRRSRIINIVADWGFPMHNILTGPSIYVAAKYAIHGFGVALHREIASSGVSVTNIYPGIVASDQSLDAPVAPESPIRGIPLRDLAALVLTCTQLSSTVVRHLVLSPDEPDYTGL